MKIQVEVIIGLMTIYSCLYLWSHDYGNGKHRASVKMFFKNIFNQLNQLKFS